MTPVRPADMRPAPGNRRPQGRAPGDWEAGVFALIPCPLLRVAAERVTLAWRDDPAETLGETVQRDAIIVLTRAILDQRNGRVPSLPAAAATPLSSSSRHPGSSSPPVACSACPAASARRTEK